MGYVTLIRFPANLHFWVKPVNATFDHTTTYTLCLIRVILISDPIVEFIENRISSILFYFFLYLFYIGDLLNILRRHESSVSMRFIQLLYPSSGFENWEINCNWQCIFFTSSDEKPFVTIKIIIKIVFLILYKNPSSLYSNIVTAASDEQILYVNYDTFYWKARLKS